VSGVEERIDEMAPDEPARARDECPHVPRCNRRRHHREDCFREDRFIDDL
jgi:hypothetical protein